MIFTKRQTDNSINSQLREKIKKDLLRIFGEKGIDVSGIDIKMKPDAVNISVFIQQRDGCRIQE